MALTREERKLLHQKSKQPTFGINKPDIKEGHNGDISFRKIDNLGTVQYLKQNGDWTPMSSSGSMPSVRSIDNSSSTSSGINDHGELRGLGSDDHAQYLLISGTRAMIGNLDMGTNNIGSVGTLDVDGHTTLDQVTVNTTDGSFAVSGANPITLTTTGTNDIDITTAQNLDVGIGVDYQLDVTRTCDWNTTNIDWDNSADFDLTSVGDLTIETSGAASAKTILLFNDNNHASAFRGIHLKTDSQNAGSSQNSIFIECDNRAAKGGGIGVDIRSEDGVLIRGEDATNGDKSIVQIRATGSVDIAGDTNSITATTSSPHRVKIHGAFDTSNLYRADPDVAIVMDNGTIAGGSANGEYTKFQALDTLHLVRAMTYKASATVARTASHTIVSAANDDNAAGTSWLITIVWKHASTDVNSQLWMCSAVGSADNTLISVKISENLESTDGTAAGTLEWTDGAGIVWTNEHSNDTGSNATMKASALRIQSGTNDF